MYTPLPCSDNGSDEVSERSARGKLRSRPPRAGAFWSCVVHRASRTTLQFGRLRSSPPISSLPSCCSVRPAVRGMSLSTAPPAPPLRPGMSWVPPERFSFVGAGFCRTSRNARPGFPYSVTSNDALGYPRNSVETCAYACGSAYAQTFINTWAPYVGITGQTVCEGFAVDLNASSTSPCYIYLTTDDFDNFTSLITKTSACCSHYSCYKMNAFLLPPVSPPSPLTPQAQPTAMSEGEIKLTAVSLGYVGQAVDVVAVAHNGRGVAFLEETTYRESTARWRREDGAELSRLDPVEKFSVELVVEHVVVGITPP